MQYFYDLAEIEPQKMPGRERRLVVGEQVMMLYIEREGGTEQNHTHDVEQLIYLMKGAKLKRVKWSTYPKKCHISWMPPHPSLISVYIHLCVKRRFEQKPEYC